LTTVQETATVWAAMAKAAAWMLSTCKSGR